MKAAVLIAPDWPGDEVCFAFPEDELPLAVAHFLRKHGRTFAARGEGEVILTCRPAFRAVRGEVKAALGGLGETATSAPAWLKAFDARLDMLARLLATHRDDDKSGDPLPGTALHAAMAAELAEAGR